MLVQGRECGGCTICCEVLSIDTRQLAKPAGVLCPHNSGNGCSIYAVRHDVCREWHCGWRMSDIFSDEWRPDRSGILVEILTQGIPDGFEPPAIKLSLLRSTDAVLWPPLVELVMLAAARDTPLFLELPGPAGHLAARTFLNLPALIVAAANGERAAVESLLQRAAACLTAHRWEKIPA